MSNSLSDFAAAVDKLESNGSNWVMWQSRFTIAVQQKEVYGHFDGSATKPTMPDGLTGDAKTAKEKEILMWNKKETLAKYLLTQKLPDQIYAKYISKTSAHDMWKGLVTEFTKKSMLMKANLHAEFMQLRYQKNTDLRNEFDRVRMKYVALLNAGIPVSADDYRSLILNFVPPEYGSFLAHISAGIKAYAMINPTSPTADGLEVDCGLDAEALMQFAIEEWDRREPERKGKAKATSNDTGTALATVSSEKPGARAGGGDKTKRGRRFGECWNCGGKGHRRDTCPTPKKDKDSKDSSSDSKKDPKNENKSNSNNRGKGNSNSSGSNSNSGASSSKKTDANAAVDEVEGAWAVMSPAELIFDDLYEFLTELDEDDMPELESVTADAEDPRDDLPDTVRIKNGSCRNEAEIPKKLEDNHGPSAEGLIVDYDFSGRLFSDEVAVFAATNKGISPSAWDLYDSGASHHMSPCREDFINFQSIPEKSLTAANQQHFSALGMGDMIISVPNGSKETKMKLTRVLYTPDLGFTLISVGRMDDAGYYVTFGGGKCCIRHDRKVIGTMPKSGGVYRLPHSTHVAAAATGIKRITLHELHNRLGHIAPQALKDLIRHGIVDGVVLTDDSADFECKPCILAKSAKKSVPNVREGERAMEFAEEIHSDLWGPAQTATLGGRQYYISFTDDWSRWTTVCLLKQKSEAFRAYKEFAAWILTHFDKRVECLRSDRGGEYLSEAFISYLDENGTERKLTVHDTPSQNGVSERLNRTLIEKVRAVMIASQLPCFLWGEALMHVVWLKNRTWTRALPKGVTPYELVIGDTPVLRDIPEWGSVVWVHDTSSGKLGIRAKEGRWVGYDLNSLGHRVYWKDRRAVTVERNVVFSKENLPSVHDLDVSEFEGENEAEAEEVDVNLEPAKENEESAPEDEPKTTEPALIAPENHTMPALRRSSRIKKPSQYVKDLQSGEFVTGSDEKFPTGLQVPELEEPISGLAMATAMGEASGLEPRSLAEAKKRPDWLRWKEAMDEELVALQAHKTWEIIDAPKGSNIVGCRWVYAVKKDAAGNVVRYKARLVAQGFSQVPGVDFFDTYAPVAKMATIRTVLALAARYDHEIHQVDIKNAFLNGEFEENETIYMKLPPELELTKEKGKVLKLLKPIYGLRQSARHWYTRLWGVLRKGLKMKRCEVDQAAFYWREGEDLIQIVVHVDDLTIITSSMMLMEKVKSVLKKDFKISDMGEIHWILGFEVKRNREKRTLSLSQALYIKSILERYGFENIRPRAAPMDPNLKLSTSDSPKTPQEFAMMRDKPYRESIGSGQYASCGTRLNITYVVNTLSRYLENPGPTHWGAVKHMFAYLAGTIDYELTYGKERKDLEGYGDADGSTHEDRKAISGYAFMIDGGAVSWSTKKQEIISLSTTEAEYVAATHAAKEAVWLRTLISELYGEDLIKGPTTLHSDNQSAIALTKDHQYHARTKHIDIRFHFIRWVIEEGKVKLVYCPTNDMLADSFTKALPSAKVKHFAAALGLSRD